jgi:hypothetical protein
VQPVRKRANLLQGVAGQRGNPFQRLPHRRRHIRKLDFDRFDLQPDGRQQLADARMQVPAEPLALQFDLVNRAASSAPLPGLPGEPALGLFQTEIAPQKTVLERQQTLSTARRGAGGVVQPSQATQVALEDKRIINSFFLGSGSRAVTQPDIS